MAESAQTKPARLPPPSPELVLLGVLVRAHLRTMKALEDPGWRRKDRKLLRRVFIKEVEAAFEMFDETANIVRIRSKKHDADVTKARECAKEWWQQMKAAYFDMDVLNGD